MTPAQQQERILAVRVELEDLTQRHVFLAGELGNVTRRIVSLKEARAAVIGLVSVDAMNAFRASTEREVTYWVGRHGELVDEFLNLRQRLDELQVEAGTLQDAIRSAALSRQPLSS